jgi:hypothetical protein
MKAEIFGRPVSAYFEPGAEGIGCRHLSDGWDQPAKKKYDGGPAEMRT